MRPTQPSRTNRADSEDYERYRHRLRRLVHVVLDLVAHPRWAIERQIHQPEHIERRHQRGGITNKPQDAIRSALRSPRLPQNFVLRKETGERKNSRDGKRRAEGDAERTGGGERGALEKPRVPTRKNHPPQTRPRRAPGTCIPVARWWN